MAFSAPLVLILLTDLLPGRPVLAIMVGLLPVIWGSGAGGTVMRRMAASMIGGMVNSTVLTLSVPAIDLLWRSAELRRAPTTTHAAVELSS